MKRYTITLTRDDITTLLKLDGEKSAVVFDYLESRDIEVTCEHELYYYVVRAVETMTSVTYDEYVSIYEHLDYKLTKHRNKYYAFMLDL